MEAGIVIIVLGALVVGTWLVQLPYQIAKNRGHPNKDAILVLAIVGVLFLGLGWLAALVWAFTAPAQTARDS